MEGDISKARAHLSIADFFDDYVRNVFPARRKAAGANWPWPGDEWADETLRRNTIAQIIGDADATAWKDAVEFGPGAGKYTAWILEDTRARLLCYEISDAFIEVLEQRFSAEIAAGRLDIGQSRWTDNAALLSDFRRRREAVDLVFAIDVFMMMDFQTVFVYLVSAANMLRIGGRLFATFADGASDSGWERMLRDLGRHSAFSDEPCTRFHWVSPELLEAVLPRMGFGDLRIERGPAKGLDICRLYVEATLVDPALARSLVTA